MDKSGKEIASEIIKELDLKEREDNYFYIKGGSDHLICKSFIFMININPESLGASDDMSKVLNGEFCIDECETSPDDLRSELDKLFEINNKIKEIAEKQCGKEISSMQEILLRTLYQYEDLNQHYN